MRLSFFAGLGTVTAELEVTNPRAAKHPGGAWDLGDPGSAFIRDLSIELATDVNNLADVWGSLDHSDHMEPAGRRFAVYQDSSGGSNWQHVNHVNRDGRVAATFRGFRAMRDERLIEGLRATPIASIGGGSHESAWRYRGSGRCSPNPLKPTAGDAWSACSRASTATCTSCRAASAARSRSRCVSAATPCRPSRSRGPDRRSRVSADPLSYRQAGAWAPLSAGSRRVGGRL